MDALRRKVRQSWAYNAVKRARIEKRLFQVRDRALPDFVIIGVHKGGTSSIYKNLTTHPKIEAALTKEVHFFDQYPQPAERWYRAHFPSQAALKSAGAVTGEATPNYCLMPHVATDIKGMMPDVKMLMMLRDPVSRAYSAFRFNQRRGDKGISFEDWIARDFDLIGDRHVDVAALHEWLGRDANIGKTPVGLLRGVYVAQIKHWHSVFPREQIKICDSSDYFSDPSRFLNQISTEMLGLPPHTFEYQKTHHEKRGYPPMLPETKERLQTFFKPYNEELYDYLGRDFGW